MFKRQSAFPSNSPVIIHPTLLPEFGAHARFIDVADVIETLWNSSKSLNTTSSKPRDCSEIYNSGERSDGVYTVYSGKREHPIDVYCDMVTEGGGWTVRIGTFYYANVFFVCVILTQRSHKAVSRFKVFVLTSGARCSVLICDKV